MEGLFRIASLLFLLLAGVTSLPALRIFCINSGNVQSNCPNIVVQKIILDLIRTGERDVDRLQMHLEDYLDYYVEVNGGQWLVSVSSYVDFSFCAPPIVQDLLTSCIIMDSASKLVFIAMKVFDG